jgi:signal transduction histidine kinase
MKRKAYLDIIVRNAKRLQGLTEDILDVTRIESKSLELKKEEFDLDEMILNAISDAKDQIPREGNRLELKSSRHNDLFIEADKGRINQVIMNLLNNAVKFTHEGPYL